MTRVLRCAALIGGLMTALACGTERPTAPSAVPGPPTGLQPPSQPPQRLPLAELVATYSYSGPLDYAIHSLTTGSQYLLYDNGEFAFRYHAFGYAYLGTYQQGDATITFRFGSASSATGTLKGDLMEIRYNAMMQQADFDNAVYRRSQ
jgi:hypothetical protein